MVKKASIPIFDGHNDILEKIYLSEDPLDASAFLNGMSGHLDFPRARQAGFGGGFFAVYPPDPPQIPSEKKRIITTGSGYTIPLPPPLEYEYARQAAQTMIELIYKIESHAAGEFLVIRDYPALESCLRNNIMAAVLHLEGAEPVQPDLGNLEEFYQAGVRSIGITWSRPNAFGHGVPFQYPGSPDTGPGLTDHGKALVEACNHHGILVDLAHLNERGFWEVAELSRAPLVSSHTAAHALVPRTRNLTDEQLKAVGKSGGVVGVIFSVNDLAGGKKPNTDAPLSALVRHISYIANLIGEDHVAFGSDLDGTIIPSEIGDVTGFPRLLSALKNAGFADKALEKISYRNWLRVLEATWGSSG